MNSERERPIDKISYEKPTAADLGATAAIVGASCADGGDFSEGGDCNEVGNSATGSCSQLGNSAGQGCSVTGSSPGGSCVGGVESL
jgi:hypothetical protein